MSAPILCHWNFFAVLLGAAGVYCEVYKTKSFVPTKSSVLSQACSCVCGLWKYDQRGLFGRGIPELDIKMCSSWFNSDEDIYDNNSYLSFSSEATLGATAVIGSFPWKCDFISILFIKLLQTWEAKYFFFSFIIINWCQCCFLSSHNLKTVISWRPYLQEGTSLVHVRILFFQRCPGLPECTHRIRDACVPRSCQVL